MTFSLVGRCERTGAVGAVIASASMAVAARCVAVRAGVGAVCSQSTTDPRLREALLTAMADGAAAGDALAAVEHVVSCTVYLTDIRHREPVYRVLGRHLKGVYPVFTGLVVSALARPEWLVEVTVVAVRP